MSLPSQVQIVEVGPRDGLQNEVQPIATADKLALIERLADAGLQQIEAASFVSPKWVPQMADAADIMQALSDCPRGIDYAVLTPNMKGFEAARRAGVKHVAVFASASEAFSQKNINCSITESLERFKPLMQAARQAGIAVRGYVSCVLGCPYQGDIVPTQVAQVAEQLFSMGCHQISLGDTIGVGTPQRTQQMLAAVSAVVPMNQLAGHYHDTYGMAIANIYASLEMGMTVFDSAVAGLGGCPYAAGASGNVATEDVVWLLNGLGIDSGVDLIRLVQTAHWIAAKLSRQPASRVSQALVEKAGGGHG